MSSYPPPPPPPPPSKYPPPPANKKKIVRPGHMSSTKHKWESDKKIRRQKINYQKSQNCIHVYTDLFGLELAKYMSCLMSKVVSYDRKAHGYSTKEISFKTCYDSRI